MKRMLINATQPEELRVAIAEGQHLFDLDIEVPSQEQKKSNVYKGKITRVEPSLEACFVDFGSSRHGFLPMKEICESLYQKGAAKKGGKVAIRDAVREGQEIIVQVEKEERGNKGAALTTYISLAGRYLVLMPTNPSAGGVSRRITGNDRDHLREQLQNVTTPDNVGIIVRTAGVGRDAEDLQWDLDYLLQLWTAIEQAAASRPAPFLIHQESNLFIRALRDHLRNDIGEILIDNESVYNDAREFMQQVMPHNLPKLKLYNDQVPLFNRYQIESQIESAFARTVHLPSGGAVVFDHTEALLSIDINSARATKGSDIEDTAFSTNMESAYEIARQLRLRDLGGLIVIDFIDMNSRKHQRDVEECLRKAMQIDKARVQIGRISRFGLLEMSRQRLRPSLGESSQETCPRCEGHGTIRSVESLALSILRLVEEEVMKDYTGQLIVQAPTDVINFLHNEKRSALAEVETRHRVPIIMLANQHLVTPHFEILRVKKSDVTTDSSYSRIEQPDAKVVATDRSQASAVVIPAPAVKRIVPERPAPARVEGKTLGFFARLANALFHSKEADKPKPAAKKKAVEKDTSRSPQANQQAKRSTSQDTNRDNQQQKRRPTKKRTAKKTQSTGQNPQQQQRPGRKRTAKKAQGKPGQQQQPNEQNKTQQGQGKPQQSGQAGPSEADSNKPKATNVSAPADADGNTQPEAKEGGNRKGGRRRRSPYKTGSSKPRPNKTESQDGNNTDSKDSAAPQAGQSNPAEKQNKPDRDANAPVKSQVAETNPAVSSVTDATPVKTSPSESKTDKGKAETAQQTAPKTEDSSRVEATSTDNKSTGESSAQPKSTGSQQEERKPSQTDVKDANGSKPKDSVSKVTEKKDDGKSTDRSEKTESSQTKSSDAAAVSGESKPAKTTKRPRRKKAASKKTAGKKTSKKASGKDTERSEKPAAPAPAPAPKPAAAVEKDSNGIYTLKPPPSG